MPLLPRDLVSRLLHAMLAGGDGVDICYAHDGARDQYLCAAIRSRVLPSLTTFLATGQRAVRHWYALHRCAVVDFASEAGCFINYNQPERKNPPGQLPTGPL
jgi:molybdopterin-guanine dinucleotide biosynthesis protein A